jgi:uncharacterized protein YgbK (DUF1537 family)
MIGVIADDLTGAAELGAVGLRHGLRAEIMVNGGDQPDAWADLVCVNTDSRSCAPAEAGQRAADAAKLLRQAGATWIYKKVDSVLRGQVTAEVESVMKQLCLPRAFLVPANPSLGRTIRDGQYFVRGRPIHRTEFARDPEHPRKTPRVLELLQKPDTFPIRVTGVGEVPPDAGIMVGETATSQDVQQWAAQRNAQTLSAGGAEFFGALLTAEDAGIPATTGQNFPATVSDRELFVCGTASRSCRKFVKDSQKRGTPVFSLPLELVWRPEFTPGATDAIGQRVVAAFKAHPRVILNVGLPPVREPAIARRLSNHLVQIAVATLQRVAIGHVFAEGGATAAELVRRMGWTRLSTLRESAPGVATMAVEGNSSLLLTIKPGSYAWPAQWTHAGAI